VLLGIGAYGLWGLLPLYFAAITEVPPAEVFAHRALWSFLLLAVIVAVARRWRDLALSLRRGKAVVAVTASAVLIAANRRSARSRGRLHGTMNSGAASDDRSPSVCCALREIS
jgi:RarD protein